VKSGIGKQRKPKAPTTQTPRHWAKLDPTYRPEDGQSEADEDLSGYLRRLEKGLEKFPNRPGDAAALQTSPAQDAGTEGEVP
jgi:hypothetical protein